VGLWDAFVYLSKILPELVFPLALAWLLCVGAFLGRGLSRRRRASLGLAIALLWLAGNGLVAQALVRSLERRYLPDPDPPAVPAIVVLGGVTQPALPPRTAVEIDDGGDRLLHAARLYRAGKAPRVLICAGRPGFGTYGVPEAADMVAILGLLGVPEDAILQEARSRNTYENAVEAKRVLEPLGIRRILLVTSALHMPRAVGLFRHQGFDVVPAPTDFQVVDVDRSWRDQGVLYVATSLLLPNAEALASTTRALRELLGLAVYRVLGRLG
jgi:uncharacterized SAM-binding protein YcdF (DUF218 family)